jgi:hypothetical protein
MGGVMAYDSADAIRTRIAQVDAQIDAAIEAQQFSLDTGQGRQSVQRPSIDRLWWLRERLLRRLESLEPGGLISVEYRRRG